MDIENAPKVELNKDAELFLVRELFGEQAAREEKLLDELDQEDAREVREGLDFF